MLNDTKNYVDNSNSYSTDEKKTGEKWIDGKPIYRGEKKIVPLTSDIEIGVPVGTLISQYKKVEMSGYLYCDGYTFDDKFYLL